jgi:hypothetical protein
MLFENYADTLYGRDRHRALHGPSVKSWDLKKTVAMVTASVTEEQREAAERQRGKPTFMT